MNTVLVFTGRSGVDSEDFRQQLLRVPEVSTVLKSAQMSLEQRGMISKDLVSFIQSDSNEYLSGGLWREFSAQLIQIGLFKRYQKLSYRPQFIIGDAGECSATAVCLGQMTLGELVDNFINQLEKRSVEEQSSEFLVGHRLETAKVYELSDEGYVVTSEGKETWSLLEGICKDHLVDQVITLGTTSTTSFNQDLGVVESVVVDPLLSWIVPHLKRTFSVVSSTAAAAAV